MANRQVKCPQCGHEFSTETKWGVRDWALYLVAVGPIGLMALVIVAMGLVAMLRYLGVTPQ